MIDAAGGARALRDHHVLERDVGAQGQRDLRQLEAAYLPIERPIEVQAGDCLEVYFQRPYPDAAAERSFRQAYRWIGRVLRGDAVVGSFAQAMDAAA